MHVTKDYFKIDGDKNTTNHARGNIKNNNYYYTEKEVDFLIKEKIKMQIILISLILLIAIMILLIVALIRQGYEMKQIQEIIYKIEFT